LRLSHGWKLKALLEREKQWENEEASD